MCILFIKHNLKHIFDTNSSSVSNSESKLPHIEEYIVESPFNDIHSNKHVSNYYINKEYCTIEHIYYDESLMNQCNPLVRIKNSLKCINNINTITIPKTMLVDVILYSLSIIVYLYFAGHI